VNGHITPPSNYISPPAPNNCYYGQVLQGSLCGPGLSCPACSATVTTGCIPPSVCVNDGNCPMPKCVGILPLGGQFCPNAATGLNQDYPVSGAANGVCSSLKCQYRCVTTNGQAYSFNTQTGTCSWDIRVAPSVNKCASSTCHCTQRGNTTVNDCSPAAQCTTSANENLNIIEPTCMVEVPGGTNCSNPGAGCGNPGTPNTYCAVDFTFQLPA